MRNDAGVRCWKVPSTPRPSGLHYASDEQPGLARVARKGSFLYRRPSGAPVKDPATLRRIAALVLPPAWTRVWICPDPRGHLQATGRDARGRKQYRYHDQWRLHRDEAKYQHIVAFARGLPKVRRRVRRDLARPGLSREKVVALVVRLLESTLIRVGNDEYARDNGSYGLTTMRNRHVRVRGEKIEFEFLGKSGIRHRIGIEDARLARIVRRCQDLPGQHLFGYRDGEGKVHRIGSQDVNGYLHEALGDGFTAKDFRIWTGTVLAAVAFREFAAATSAAEAKRNVAAVVASVAKVLGNTPAVCRKCYIHPEIVQAYLEGVSLEAAAPASQRIGENLEKGPRRIGRFRPMEAAVLALLRRRLRAGNRLESGGNERPWKTARHAA